MHDSYNQGEGMASPAFNAASFYIEARENNLIRVAKMISRFLEKRSNHAWMIGDDEPGLSLGPPQFQNESSSSFSSELDSALSRKRRDCWEEAQSNIELHLEDPLPVDWEQCLDLESGRMYYINRKTLKKSWNFPKIQKLDLELNVSTFCGSGGSPQISDSSTTDGCNSNMVAMACTRCHILVMLSKSTPACPNCKYVHSFQDQRVPLGKVKRTKVLETLSLLN